MLSNYITKSLCKLLKENTEARDNMMLCVRHIHDLEMSILGISKADYYEAVFAGELSSVKTIDRIWRKLQEDIPELRGAEWHIRQRLAGLIDVESLSHLRNQLELF